MTPQQSSKHPKHYASMFCTGRNLVQAIPSGADTIVVFDTEQFDILSEYNNVVANAFQPIEAGYYFFHAGAGITDLNVGDIFRILFYLNAGASLAYQEVQANSLNEDMYASISALVYLIPTDIVRVRVFHNFGANRNIFGNQWATRFAGFRVG